MLFIVALFAPRLAAVLLWFFTDWFKGVFETQLWPIVGFLFMPYTILWYTAVVHWFQGSWGFWQIAVLIVAIFFDLSSNSGAKKHS